MACWGADTWAAPHGQATAPAGSFSSVSAGGRHSCAVKSDATLACWGSNIWGQVTAPAGSFSSVSAGDDHSCAVANDATVACWGANAKGQRSVPYGAFPPSKPPPQPLPPPPPPPPPSVAGVAAFIGSPTKVRVSPTGRVSYRFVATPLHSGTIKLVSTRKVKVGSKKRKLKAPAMSFRTPLNAKVKVKLKLSRTDLKVLKRVKRLPFKVSVTLGGRTFTTRVTLDRPKTRSSRR